MKKIKILVTGVLPPPYGGVSVFLKRFIVASNDNKHVSVKLFDFKRFLFGGFDVLHINATHPIKRFFFVILGRLWGKRVYFTIHGGLFAFDNSFNYLSIFFSNGVFCLNDKVGFELKEKKINHFKHSTIFQENVEKIKNNKIDGIKGGGKKILFYIQNNKSVANGEIYGAEFIYKVMEGIFLNENIEMIVVDLSQSYAHLFQSKSCVSYIDKPVDFIEVLGQSDIYIRPTATDGMSVALLEAGILGVSCLASDVVDRPDFVSTYKFGSESDFLSKLEFLLNNDDGNKLTTDSLTGIDSLLDFMK